MTHLKNHITHKSGKRKTVCTSAVLSFFSVAISEYHYSGQWGDIERILRRKGWSVRSRASQFNIKRNRVTIGQLRQKITKAPREIPKYYVYYVGVCGHAMVLDCFGNTIVDTAPRFRDRRVVNRIYKIYKSKNSS